MGLLPVARNTTYTPGDPVKSVDLNDVQDCIVGDKHPEQWRWRFPSGIPSQINPPTLDGALSGLWFGYWTSTDPGGLHVSYLVVPITPNVGDRITKVGARVLGTAADDVLLDLFRSRDGAIVGPILGNDPAHSLKIPTPPAAWATYTAALVAPETVLDQWSYFLQFTFKHAGSGVAVVGYAADRI